MTLKVIGAGLGRTGTMSLKLALEKLLDGPCYHMTELYKHMADHVPLFHAAARGEYVEWDRVFSEYVAAVDEPVSPLWESICAYYPEALVILSVRDPEEWWQSADATIMDVKREKPSSEDPERQAWHAMVMEIYRRIYPEGLNNPESSKTGFIRHMEQVKAGIPDNRLLIWQVSDGWAPICQALNLPIPEEPFPHSNTRAEFQARHAARRKQEQGGSS